MKRAIVKRFIVVLIVAMAISSIVISMSYYRLASHRVMEDMKSVLLLLDATIDWESSDLEKQIIEISSQMNNDYRITIIDNDGIAHLCSKAVLKSLLDFLSVFVIFHRLWISSFRISQNTSIIISCRCAD